MIWAPNWVDFFAIGMAMATYSAAHHAGHAAAVAAAVPRRPPRGVVGDRRRWSGLSFATFSPPDTPGVYGAEYWFRWFLFGVFAFFLLAPAMFGDQTQGSGRRFLASQPLVLLGTVSLGFYLFHLAVMSNVQEWLAPAGTSSVFYGSLPAVFSLTFVGVDRARVRELLPGREAVPAAQGQAGHRVVAAHGRSTRDERPEPAHAGHHPGVQRGGVAARGAQGARRADARLRRARRVRRLDRPHRRASRRPPACTWRRCRSTSGSAARCAPGSRSRCGAATSARCSSTPTASTIRSRCAPLLDGLDARRRHGDRQPLRRGRRGHLRGERHPASGDEGAAVAGRGARAPALHRHQLRVPRVLAADARVLRRDVPGRVHGLGRGAGAGVQRRVPGGGGARPTCAAAPAARRAPGNFKLVYYYVRLLVVLLVSTTSRGQRARRTADRDGDDERTPA